MLHGRCASSEYLVTIFEKLTFNSNLTYRNMIPVKT